MAKVEFTAAAREEYGRILARYPHREGALLPVLHLAQREWGYLSEDAVRHVAELLKLPPARVGGVISFYPEFRTRPIGKHLIEICRTLPCSLMGAEEVVDYLCERLGIEPGETTADGRFTLTGVECLGSCGTAPVMMVDGELHQSLTREKIDQILEGLC